MRRNPEHQAFGAGGRHFCLGTALARLELRIMFEETLARYPEMERPGPPTFVESGFINQLKTLPVTLGAALSAALAQRRSSATRTRASAVPAATSSSARITCMTALMSARCVNACGKLPRCRPVCGSISSA